MIDYIARSHHACGIGIGYLDTELFLKGHDQFYAVQSHNSISAMSALNLQQIFFGSARASVLTWAQRKS